MSQKSITIQDIAINAKVSKSTVSRVLNNSTPVDAKKRAAVLKAMENLKFRPNVFARTLAGGRSMTLGIITQNISSPFYDAVTQGVIKGLNGTDFTPIIVDGQWSMDIEKSAISTLIERQVDGLIMVGGNLDSEALDEIRGNVPMVLVARQLDGWEDRSVFIDNVAAAKKATQFLIESGHRNIAHIAGIKDHQDATNRLLGYRQALREANLDIDDELIVQGDFSGQSGVLAVETLLLRGVNFSAIFSSNDEMAMGARLALYRRGIRVPDEVSIVGFDDQSNSAFMTPPLTTISQPATNMGRTASSMLISLVNEQDFDPPELAANLVIRESVSRLR